MGLKPLMILSLVFFLSCMTGSAQGNPETFTWYFGPNEMAVDASKLETEFSARGFTRDFFASNDVLVTITGYADCPTIEARNAFTADARASYMENFLHYLAGPGLNTKKSSLVEKDCVPGTTEDNRDHRKVVVVITLPEKEADLPPPPPPAVEPEGLEKINTLHENETIVLEGLNFHPGSHRTLPEAKPVLRKLLNIMKENPSLKIEIQGHVCCGKKPQEDGLDEETSETNLSWTRAQFVYDYLIENGIDSSRLSFKGFALTKPLVWPEVTIQDQIKNRRVEVMVLSK